MDIPSALKEKILITGSKGLIGQSLKNRLYSLGFEFKGIDSAYPNNHLEFGDIQDIPLLKNLASECTGIVHLAGVSRVIAGEKNPSLCWDSNVEGTQKILEVAKNSPSNPWVIYASSREVYGQQDALPVKEDAALLPVNIYARSKVAAEKLVLDYRSRGLQTAIIRFSNVYGSVHDHSDRVIPAFCNVAAGGGTIRIDGGHNIFDFTYIDDVISGVMKVIDKLRNGSFDLPALHLTSGQGTTLLQAAELAKSVSKKPIEFIHAPSRSFDVSTFYGDPALTNSLLGWKTKVTIQEGIEKLVKDFKDIVLPHDEYIHLLAR
jgi:nucleoside-diphosphate-sugar epimerase